MKVDFYISEDKSEYVAVPAENQPQKTIKIGNIIWKLIKANGDLCSKSLSDVNLREQVSKNGYGIGKNIRIESKIIDPYIE